MKVRVQGFPKRLPHATTPRASAEKMPRRHCHLSASRLPALPQVGLLVVQGFGLFFLLWGFGSSGVG